MAKNDLFEHVKFFLCTAFVIGCIGFAIYSDFGPGANERTDREIIEDCKSAVYDISTSIDDEAKWLQYALMDIESAIEDGKVTKDEIVDIEIAVDDIWGLQIGLEEIRDFDLDDLSSDLLELLE